MISRPPKLMAGQAHMSRLSLSSAGTASQDDSATVLTASLLLFFFFLPVSLEGLPSAALPFLAGLAPPEDEAPVPGAAEAV